MLSARTEKFPGFDWTGLEKQVEAQVEKELPPIQSFSKHLKEKEMRFRNAFIALTVMALFAGLASAQLQILSPINCTVTAPQSLNVRSEGITEKVGDVYIKCETSATVATSGPVTRGNLLVDFGAPVTSKALNSVNNVGAQSEVLLLINDPGASNGPVAGYGQNAALTYCSALNAQADAAAEITGNTLVATNCPTVLVPKPNSAGTQTYWELDNGSGTTTAANAYQGAIGGNKGNVSGLVGVPWTGNQVMFFNVPIYPAYNSSQSNTFRIVNARVTPGASATISASMSATVLQANASSYVTGSTYNYVFNGTPAVASASGGLTTSLTSTLGANICNSTSLNPAPGQSKANLAPVVQGELLRRVQDRLSAARRHGRDHERDGRSRRPGHDQPKRNLHGRNFDSERGVLGSRLHVGRPGHGSPRYAHQRYASAGHLQEPGSEGDVLCFDGSGHRLPDLRAAHRLGSWRR